MANISIAVVKTMGVDEIFRQMVSRKASAKAEECVLGPEVTGAEGPVKGPEKQPPGRRKDWTSLVSWRPRKNVCGGGGGGKTDSARHSVEMQ